MKNRRVSIAFLALVFAFLLPIGIVFSAQPIEQVRAEITDYSNVDLSDLEIIKDNSSELSKVIAINDVRHRADLSSSEYNKVKQQLGYISLCPNLVSINLGIKGLTVDKNEINSWKSTKSISLSFTDGTVDFSGVYNSNVNDLFLYNCDMRNSSGVVGFINLKTYSLNSVSGFTEVYFENLKQLETVNLNVLKIDNYNSLCSHLANVENISLCGNLQNSDTKYLSKLKKVKTLSLEGSFVDDISFLSQLPQLVEVTLPLGVDNLSVLYSMPNLKKVEYDGYTAVNVDSAMLSYMNRKGIQHSNMDSRVISKLNEGINSLGITSSMGEKDKIDKISHYVTLHMRYDDNYATFPRINCVVNEAGVCGNYAMFTYAMLKMAGIEAYYVGGIAYDRDGYKGLHAWNVVKCNGGWYGIDTAWMDPGSSNSYTASTWSDEWCNYYFKKTTTDNKSWPNSLFFWEFRDRGFALTHITYNNPEEILNNVVQSEAVTLSQIKVETLPSKRSYIQDTEDLDLSGIAIKAYYSDGSSKSINVSDCTISGFNNSIQGTKVVEVSYNGKSDYFEVSIIAKSQPQPEPQPKPQPQPVVLDSIGVVSLPNKLNYIQNTENLILDGLSVRGYYSDGTNRGIDINDCRITGFSNAVAGSCRVEVLYGGMKDYFTVNIIEKPQVVLNSIKVTPPTKLNYIQDTENLNTSGMVVKGYYSDNTEKTIAISDCTISGFSNSTVGEKRVYVVYGGRFAYFTVNITEKPQQTPTPTPTPQTEQQVELVSIKVLVKPTKLNYIQNVESLDLAGMVVKAYYSNGTDKYLAISNCDVYGFDNSKVCQKNIYISYENRFDYFIVNIIPNGQTQPEQDEQQSQTQPASQQTEEQKDNIDNNEKVLVSMEVYRMPSKTTYLQNSENLDLTSGLLMLHYSDDSVSITSMRNGVVTTGGFDNSKAGENTIQVFYKNVMTTFNVEIIANSISGNAEISVNTNQSNSKGLIFGNKSWEEIGIYTLIVVSGLIMFVVIILLIRRKGQKIKK